MSEARRIPSLFILVAISALQPIALNLLAPATPALARQFGASYATIQLTLTVFLIAVAVMQLVVGPLSDRYGRRPCVNFGIALFAVGSLAGAFAQSTGALLAARALEGAGSGAAFALSRAIIRDTAGRDAAASRIATVTMVMVVAPMLSPFIGGHIETAFGWRTIFWVMTSAGIVVLLLTLRLLPETAPNLGVRTPFTAVFKAFPTLVRDRSFLMNVTALSATSASFFGFIAAAPYIVVEAMGHGSHVYGTYFILTAFGYMVGNFFMSRLAMKKGAAVMLRLGLVISSAALTVTLVLSLLPSWSPLTFFLPLIVNAVGNGMTIPGATAEGLSARPELAGSAAGLMGAIQLGAGALSAVLASWLVTIWPPALPFMMWAATGLALLVLLRAGRA